jgi:MGT family glycosyltransferase
MSHFAIIAPDEAGHILPNGNVGAALVRRGHRVTVLGQRRSATLAGKLALPFRELSFDDLRFAPSRGLGLLFHLAGAGGIIGMRDLFTWHAEALLRTLPAVLQELAVDGLIVDQVAPAAGTVAEHLGLPFVTTCTATPWHEEAAVPPPFTHSLYRPGWAARWSNRRSYALWHWFMRPIMKTINGFRRQWKLGPFQCIEDLNSPLAQLSQFCEEFDFPRRELPAMFHYVGSLTAEHTALEVEFPWERLDGRPLIFASLGTVNDPENRPVFRKILDACDGLDAQVVLGLGRWDPSQKSLRDELGPLPANAIVADLLPQLQLLDRAALLITHGGVNTVLNAISRGIPIVALPRGADQPGMCARIVFAGIGGRVPFARSTVAEVRQLVEQVLKHDSFRQRARQLQQAMLAAGGVPRAAEIAEQALTTGRPVFRGGEGGLSA